MLGTYRLIKCGINGENVPEQAYSFLSWTPGDELLFLDKPAARQHTGTSHTDVELRGGILNLLLRFVITGSKIAPKEIQTQL